MLAQAYVPLDPAVRNVGALFALTAAVAMAIVVILTVRRGRKGDFRLTFVACMCSLYAADILHGPQSAAQSQTMSTLAVAVAVFGLICWTDALWYTTADKRTSLIACVLGGFAGLTIASILAADSTGKGSLGAAFMLTFQWLMVVNAALGLWLGWRLISEGYFRYLVRHTPAPVAEQEEALTVAEPVIGE